MVSSLQQEMETWNQRVCDGHIC